MFRTIIEHFKNRQLRRGVVLTLSVGGAGLVIFFLLLKWNSKPNRPGGLAFSPIDSIALIPFDVEYEKVRPLQALDILAYMPPAADQKDQGACAPFSIGYYLMSYYEKRRSGYSYEVTDNIPNPEKVISPAFIFNALKYDQGNSDCYKGVSFTSIFSFIRNYGACTWKNYPYSGQAGKCLSKPNRTAYENAKQYIGYRFYQIDRDLATLKNYLDAGIPIMVGIYTSKNMDVEGYDHDNKAAPYLWSPSKNDIAEYHSMLCVGYDDSLKTLVLLNSWGKDWGNNGYCYTPYRTFFDRAREMYIARIKRVNSLGERNILEKGVSASADSNNPYSLKLARNNVKKLDSLFAADVRMLRSVGNKTDEQKELLNSLKTYIQDR